MNKILEKVKSNAIDRRYETMFELTCTSIIRTDTSMISSDGADGAASLHVHRGQPFVTSVSVELLMDARRRTAWYPAAARVVAIANIRRNEIGDFMTNRVRGL
jgi:hypothetical protein